MHMVMRGERRVRQRDGATIAAALSRKPLQFVHGDGVSLRLHLGHACRRIDVHPYDVRVRQQTTLHQSGACCTAAAADWHNQLCYITRPVCCHIVGL